ncbi:PREDICTED: ephrin-B2-like [Branchiostoma belcheri]|uniref:Ephrin-B2-like n=1 Tax=Branchiostoma belcheri TaxID=7741 RepID=A0A6P4YVB6_BRABE|nr:PREDICTED: ephrin-B2-like [Branchiostoma belcheri]
MFAALLVVMLSGLGAAGSRLGAMLEPIYWNSSNPLLSGWGYSITVELDDKVDIVCPRVFNRSRQDPQYNTLYQVQEDGYVHCDASQGKMLLRCDKPFQDNRFTMLFQEFSPSPFGLEFKPGRDYYYISTSTSELGGLDNKVGGNCRNGMRLKITVNQQTNIIPPVENTSESSHYVVDLTPNSIPREDTPDPGGGGSSTQANRPTDELLRPPDANAGTRLRLDVTAAAIFTSLQLIFCL